MDPSPFILPEDGWFHIAAFGEWPHKPTGLTQIIDEESVDEIIKAFTEFAAAPNWPGVLVDFDHQSLDQDKPTVAAGWIIGLAKRPTGLWAQVRWSDLGRKSLEGGRYRFISPVWRSSDCAKLGDDRIRPLKLMNCAVTNDPNIKGLFPLSNSAKADAPIVAPPMEIPQTTEAPPSSRAKPTVSIPAAFLRNRRPLTDKQLRYLHAQQGREISGSSTSGTWRNPFSWGAPSSPSSAAPPAAPSPTEAAPGPQSGYRVRSLEEAESIAREIANLPPGATAEDINAILDKYRTRPTQGRAAPQAPAAPGTATAQTQEARAQQAEIQRVAAMTPAERTAYQLSKKEDWELAHEWEQAELSYNRAVKLGDESMARAWIRQIEAIAAEAARRTGQAAPEAVAAVPTAAPAQGYRPGELQPATYTYASKWNPSYGNRSHRAELEFLRNSSFKTDDERKAFFARLGAGYSYGGPRATRDHDMRIRSYDQQIAALEASRRPRPERGDYDYRDWRETKARLMAAGAGSTEILAAIKADKQHNRAVRDRINSIKRDLKKVYKTPEARERAYQRRMDHEKRNHEKAVRDWEKSEDAITKAIRGLRAKRDEEVAKKADSELKAQKADADRALKLEVKTRQSLERAYREYEKTQRQREKDEARAKLQQDKTAEKQRQERLRAMQKEQEQESPVVAARREFARIKAFDDAVVKNLWDTAASLDKTGDRVALAALKERLAPLYKLAQRDPKTASNMIRAEIAAHHAAQAGNPFGA
jgi:hypothetical protein